MTSNCDTLATRLTGVGRSAVAVIGLRGPLAAQCVNDCFVPASNAHPQMLAGQVRYGTWKSSDGVPGESIVLTPMSDGGFEIHGHGGEAAVSAILASLNDRGVATVDDSRWRQNESIIVAEAERVLQRCVTGQQAAIALDQTRGALRQWCEHWINCLESANFSNESPTQQTALLDQLCQAAQTVCSHGEKGVRLIEPRRLVLAGPPNVGKSSLMNQIVGFRRSITHDAAGTTRDVLQCDTVIAGVPVRLSDTAGIRETAHLTESGASIEREGIRRASLAIETADLLLIVCQPSTLDQRARFRSELPISDRTHVLEVLNKADLLTGNETSATAPIEHQTIASDDDNPGVAKLMETLARHLLSTLPPRHSPVPICQRQQDLARRLCRANSLEAADATLKQLLTGVAQ
ncbi:GTPase and tRNA-U34 5-formylation enzyme TrmE [Rhodopirellula islandica]|uniref:GTPase and tRNA-U34 5-formylation enzyme TrmE n=1 Tax=Rhodopirellula islandica TaxID=595434 RepID=A0A0J1BGY7_RHOIS|nr:GTPase [Rhodopirellula islandica]KLU05823.1 GTPase and tRNA-U34 5-formylation enzyme TrmE [Rhodopirellula islandica]